MNKPMDNEDKHAGPPPWIQPSIQEQMTWRDGDIVVSVPAKSGTTWTMNIVYQLLTGGTSDFRDIYEEVPWIEFLGGPDKTIGDVLERVDSMPTERRRAFKTHSAPPALPFFEQGGSGPDVKYLVIFRNPEEALVSFRPFLGQHTDEWFDLWKVPREDIYRPDFPSFYSDVIDTREMQGMFFGFLASWWQLRNAPNVMFLHFSDMKHNHETSIRKIADFLGITPAPEQWPAILEYTSFAWMKQHEDKFEASTAGDVPILKSGAMIRKGQAGHAKSDGMTDEIARHLHEVGSRICTDPVAVKWYYEGGNLP